MISADAAYEYLNKIPRITSYSQKYLYSGQVFLLPYNVSFEIDENSCIKTSGLGKKWDNKSQDLLTIIEIQNAFEMKYRLTNVLTPLVYAESRSDILWHITTQGLFLQRFRKRHLNGLSERIVVNKTITNIIWIKCGYLVVNPWKQFKQVTHYAFLIDVLMDGMDQMTVQLLNFWEQEVIYLQFGTNKKRVFDVYRLKRGSGFFCASFSAGSGIRFRTGRKKRYLHLPEKSQLCRDTRVCF